MEDCRRILLLRHLPTYNNIEGYITGQCDIDIDETVKSNQVNILGVRRIYSSPLKRCSQTIKKMTRNTSPKILYDRRLIERNMGIFEGRKKPDVIKEYPEYFVGKKLNIFMEPPNGETFNEFYNRVNSFYAEVICLCNEEILICSHNHTLKLLKCIIEQKEITLEYWNSFNFSNGKIIEV